jgi:hypothetical protein
METTVFNLIVIILNLEAGTGLQKSLNHAAAADDDDKHHSTCSCAITVRLFAFYIVTVFK